MGLFDFNKKKDKLAKASTTQDSPSIPANKQFTGTSIERDVTQDVAICINSMKITEMPILKFFHNDNGIFEGIYQSHMNDPQVQMIKKTYGDDMYLNLLGCHALGAGAYITLCQGKYKKSVEDFSLAEAKEINNAFHQTDPYELALKTLGFPLDGNNKKCLDQIILVGMKSYRAAAGSQTFNKDCLKSYMHVMYNAGITVVLRG